MAKAMIADGLVEVDGVVETRKRCKIVAVKSFQWAAKIKVVE